MSQVVKTNKGEIREALTLVLQALMLSDQAPAVLARILERWAGALAAALVDARDLRQLLFLVHHLFRFLFNQICMYLNEQCCHV